MFSFSRPAQDRIQRTLESARNLPVSYPTPLNTKGGPGHIHVPRGFVRDHTRSQIGQGRAAFEAAKDAFRQWQHFNIGWVRIANAEATIATGEVIAMEAHTLFLWTLSFSRILYTIDSENSFGYGYGTTAMHVERGEERFLLEYDPASGAVHYELLAVSQPAHWLTKLGYPYARSRQRKFARDSHAKMAQTIAHADSIAMQ
jgi:uncharacterized protein (UPF0548 family)